MRLTVLLAVAVLSACAATSVAARGVEQGYGCNVRLKGLKTLSDRQAELVNLQPKNTTIAAIAALAQPRRTPTTRSTPFTRRVWRLPAQIVEFKIEGDSDIHLILFDNGSYLVAEMPAAKCIPKKARDRRAMISARKKFETECGKPTNHWQSLGAVVVISGVGFFDIPHSQKSHASNFAELHPVTGLRVVAGC
ncbi:MAG: hypothetical protein ACJ74L_03680 [Gaiellaceae bacterium]